jgi:hypothetical protein
MRRFGSVFDDVPYTIGEDPITLVANTTADELWAVINMLAQLRCQSRRSMVTCYHRLAQQQPICCRHSIFNFDEYLQDFSASVLQAPLVVGHEHCAGWNCH